jgi:hypothetical protein
MRYARGCGTGAGRNNAVFDVTLRIFQYSMEGWFSAG